MSVNSVTNTKKILICVYVFDVFGQLIDRTRKEILLCPVRGEQNKIQLKGKLFEELKFHLQRLNCSFAEFKKVESVFL